MSADEEVAALRLRLDQKLQTAISAVRRAWVINNFLFYSIRVLTITLAALVACESLLKKSGYITSDTFWDIAPVSVLILLLFELGLRPGEIRRAHLRFVSESTIISIQVQSVDPSATDARQRLSKLAERWGKLMEIHEAESS